MKQRGITDPAQKEEVRHGAYIFPLQKYHTALDPLHPVVQAHWHEESEFTLITGGRCRYHMNLDDELVEEGDLLFIPPLLLHSAAPPDPEEPSAPKQPLFPPEKALSPPEMAPFPPEKALSSPEKALSSPEKALSPPEMGLPAPQRTLLSDTAFMESDTFVFHLNFLGGNAADICSMRYLTPLQNQELTVPTTIRRSHPAYKEIREIFEELDRAYEAADAGYELAIKSLLLRLLCILIQNQPLRTQAESAGSPANIEKIRSVLSYIEEHYPEPLSIEALSSLCYFSQYHFMRFFKRHVGMTCVEYINNLRLEKALEQFEQGNTSILDVSLSVGFSNLSYFHRAFLKKYHLTPKTFLNLQRENHTFS